MTTSFDLVDSGAAFEGSLRRALVSLIDAYRYMGIPIRRYLLFMLGPTALFAVGITVWAAVSTRSTTIELPLVGLTWMGFFTVLVYPKIAENRRRKDIQQRFHLYITHLTVLALTNIDRVEIFRILANQQEYGTLADEMSKLVALIDTWNQSLDDACRMRAKRVSSPLLSDFLERLAYSVGSGQPIGEFLVNEQDSIIQQFAIRYESDLDKLEVMKELYLSLMLSAAFILVFAVVLPLLVGVNPTVIVAGVIVVYVVIQASFLYAINQISPSDPLWFLPEETTHSPVDRVRVPLVASFVLSVVLGGVVAVIHSGVVPISPDAIPTALYLPLPLTPLLVPGFVMSREEKRITTRDQEFPSFIRALGGVESVKQTSTSNVLATLRNKDFGALTENIEALYRRLSLRIDAMEAWRLFAVETGSYLIQKFGDMYVFGRRMGGEPKQLGRIISTNLGEVLRVRKQRNQAATTLRGVIYGLTAASTFSFFVGLEIVELLMSIAREMQADQSAMSFLLNPSGYDLPLLRYLLLVLILTNAFLSTLMIRVTDRRHLVSGLLDFVLLVWIGALMAVVTGYLGGWIQL